MRDIYPTNPIRGLRYFYDHGMIGGLMAGLIYVDNEGIARYKDDGREYQNIRRKCNDPSCGCRQEDDDELFNILGDGAV